MCIRDREMISGGGPLHHAIWKDFYRRFRIPVVNAYGLSETIVVGTGTAIRPEDYRTADEFKSVGKPVGFSELKIVDVNDPNKELKLMETGEVALRGPGVACGYWDMEEETESVFLPDGWFLTGDIGHIDEDGMLSITDRKKDMIITGGENVFPREVEEVLYQHPAVHEAAVIGIPDPYWVEKVHAVVCLKKDASTTAEELIALCKKNLAGYKSPKSVEFTEAMPKNAAGKILKRELRNKYIK